MRRRWVFSSKPAARLSVYGLKQVAGVEINLLISFFTLKSLSVLF